VPDIGEQMASAPDERQARFRALVDVAYEPLQRYARRRCDPATADDVVADALLVLWRRLDDVPADAVLPWCYRVAAGCLANARRGDARRLRLVERLATVAPPLAAFDPDPLPDPDLLDALATLPAPDQEALRLWAWEGLATADLAVALDVSPNAASIRLHRAKARLAGALRKPATPAGHLPHEDPEEVT
jgi:RNA polymerase sigma-70 factor, ECF subfamily